MGNNHEVAKSLATLIQDYREGEIETPDAHHVETWLDQFDEGRDVKSQFLEELYHILKKTYASRKRVNKRLELFLEPNDFVVGEPSEFWRSTTFLSIQQGGSSQSKLL